MTPAPSGEPGRRGAGGRSGVPRLAELLFAALLRSRDRDYVLGDLAEEYHRHILPCRGRVRAQLWYWSQVVRSIGPGTVQRVGRRTMPQHRRPGFSNGIALDVRHALRGLRKTPGFTAVAILTLALGIGANSAIFSVIYSVLLAPLPFEQPEGLVQIWETKIDRGWNMVSVSEPNFWDFRELNTTFEDLAAYGGRSLNLTGSGFPEQLNGARISAGFLSILGVTPVVGRGFLPGEDQPGGHTRVAVLGHEFWRTRFGADRSVVGRTITLDNEAVTVVGVLPAGEPWLNRAQVFVPLVRNPTANRADHRLRMIGRLRPGVSVAAATTDLQRVAAELERQYPEANQGIGARIVPASEWIADDDLRLALWVLLGAVSFLLLIACVNLANLLLARATRRSREYAISAALGAGRTRIVSRVLAESLFIGGAGAAVGLLLALGAVHLLQTFGPGGIPRVAEIGLNRWVLGFTAVVAVATGAISGVIPAMEFPSGNLVGLLREGDRGVAGNRKQNRIRSALIGVEVALSLVLLVGAGLMIRSFATLRRLDTGFRPEGRLTFEVSLPPPYSDPDQTEQFLRQFLSRVNSMPQVQAAGAVSMRPVAGGTTNTAVWAVENPVGPDEPTLMADWRYVTPGFFGAMGISLERGADFTESDRLESPLRVIISHALAERLWPGESPIGRRAVLWMGQFTATVVGVVDDMRERGLQTDPTMAVYLPYYGNSWSPVHFVVHATTEPTSLVPTLRSMLAEVDPSLPLSGILTMDQIVTDSVAAERFNAVLLTFFAAIALVLALAGVYGVTVYSVTRRTSEIGVRVALGANPGSVLKQTIWYGMRPALIGIGAGLTCAFGLSRLLSNLLFGIEPSDPVTYAGVVMVLGSAALLSCYLPARRALRVDPVAALRDE